MTVDGFKPPSYYTGPPRRAPSPALVALIAVLLVVVIGGGVAVALKIGPFATAPTATGPSPTPALTALLTQVAPGTPTPVDPTLEPSGDATAPPIETPPIETPPTTGPPPTPGTATAELLSHVPPGIRDSCLPTELLEPILAIVTCVVGDGQITVEYARYPDLDSMYAAYNERVRIAEIETDSGLCYTASGGAISATPNRWPSEHLYEIGGQPVGRYLCLDPGSPSINWTDDRLIILGLASAGPELLDRLATFWVNEAGPIQ